tara:strand:- start:104 stop:325 length:222 start_codon:yes stop_codon:yes gene_type:complete
MIKNINKEITMKIKQQVMTQKLRVEKRNEIQRQINVTRSMWKKMSDQNPKKRKLEKIMARKVVELMEIANDLD